MTEQRTWRCCHWKQGLHGAGAGHPRPGRGGESEETLEETARSHLQAGGEAAPGEPCLASPEPPVTLLGASRHCRVGWGLASESSMT